MKSISKIMKMINWNSPEQVQQLGVKYACEIADIRPFIQPDNYGSKAVWDNCAIILSGQSDSDLKPYLDELLEWLQDLNWPGALKILDRLKVFSGEKLKKPFIDRYTYAKNLNNEEGLMWLDNLSELLDNKELKELLPKPIAEELKKHYQNWGYWYDEENNTIDTSR